MRHFLRLLSMVSVLLGIGFTVNAASPYRMEGIVTNVDTMLPVANATAQVFINSELDFAKKFRKSTTDDDGHYSIEVPVGHACACDLIAPPGYYAVNENATAAFATSPEKPVFTKNYQVRKGQSFHVVAHVTGGSKIPRDTFVNVITQHGMKFTLGSCELDMAGHGDITLPQLFGNSVVTCADAQGTIVAPAQMSIDFTEGFDSRNMSPEVIRESANQVLVRDSAGRTATLVNCDANVRDEQLTLVINVHAARSEPEGAKVSGRVVDADGRGIEGATVTIIRYANGAVSSSPFSAISDSLGKYSISKSPVQAAKKIGISVTRAGFGGVDSKPMPVRDAQTNIVFDDITLKPAGTIRVRVIEPGGQPLEGAVVKPGNNFASLTRIARTGADGECNLTDLAPGMIGIEAQFGNAVARGKIPLDTGQNQPLVIKVKPTAESSDAAAPVPQPALRAGTAAPEWKIADWTNGKTHKLSDYRGQVVVLDFWGTWCIPCIRGIPAIKELQERFKDRKVVFLGFHTAGTDMSLVKRVLTHEQWNVVVGLDTGESIETSETVNRYAIKYFPTVVIIDPKGNIAYNDADKPGGMTQHKGELKSLAESTGVPWPIDKNATETQVIERFNKLQVYRYAQQIDRALDASRE